MVLCQDEFSLSNTATLSATLSLKWKQPGISCKQSKKECKTGFGTVNPITEQLVVIFANVENSDTFKKHLKNVQYAYKDKQRIILYVANVRFHHSKKIKSFLKSYPQVEMRYLPAYSPDLNPVERVWWYSGSTLHITGIWKLFKERIAKFWRLMSKCLKPNMLLKNICVVKL